MDEWIDESMDEWIDEWEGGWMGRCIKLLLDAWKIVGVQ